MYEILSRAGYCAVRLLQLRGKFSPAAAKVAGAVDGTTAGGSRTVERRRTANEEVRRGVSSDHVTGRRADADEDEEEDYSDGGRRRMRDCSKRCMLTATTSFSAVVSFACLCIAVSTDFWLTSIERDTDIAGTNLTLTKTTSGLWRKCVEYSDNHPDKAKRGCSYINYFNQVDKDGLKPTDAILLSLRKSAQFPLISLVILLVGEIIGFMSHCDRRKKVLIFISGILFVIAGLCTLIGLILYIGAITEEAGNKPKSSMDEPKFQYWYGVSFILTVTSFTSAELTGVLSVYLYISRHKHAYRKKVERLTVQVDLQNANTTSASAAATAVVAVAGNGNNGGAVVYHQYQNQNSLGGGGGGQQQQHARSNGRVVNNAGSSNHLDNFYLFSPLMDDGDGPMMGAGVGGGSMRCGAGDWRSNYREMEPVDVLMVRQPSRLTLHSMSAAAMLMNSDTLSERGGSETCRRTTPV